LPVKVIPIKETRNWGVWQVEEFKEPKARGLELRVGVFLRAGERWPIMEGQHSQRVDSV
jgi:hypothetical protein